MFPGTFQNVPKFLKKCSVGTEQVLSEQCENVLSEQNVPSYPARYDYLSSVEPHYSWHVASQDAK